MKIPDLSSEKETCEKSKEALIGHLVTIDAQLEKLEKLKREALIELGKIERTMDMIREIPDAIREVKNA